MSDYYDRPYDDPMTGFDPYMSRLAAPAAPAAVPEEPITYERDIAPGARQTFDAIGSNSKFGARERIMLQREVLRDVGDLAVRQERIAQMREDSVLRRMRTEKYAMDLNMERNRRAQAQATQEQMGVLEKEMQGVLSLPEDQRQQRLAEIEVNNFGLLSSSPWAGSRFKSVRDAIVPAKKPMFSSPKEQMEFIAEHGYNPEDVNGDPVRAGLFIYAKKLDEKDAAKQAKTAEEKAKEYAEARDKIFEGYAGKPFEFEETRNSEGVRIRQLSYESAQRAHVLVDEFGDDEDRKRWADSEDSSDKDRIRAELAEKVKLKYENAKLRSLLPDARSKAEIQVP